MISPKYVNYTSIPVKFRINFWLNQMKLRSAVVFVLPTYLISDIKICKMRLKICYISKSQGIWITPSSLILKCDSGIFFQISLGKKSVHLLSYPWFKSVKISIGCLHQQNFMCTVFSAHLLGLVISRVGGFYMSGVPNDIHCYSLENSFSSD